MTEKVSCLAEASCCSTPDFQRMVILAKHVGILHHKMVSAFSKPLTVEKSQGFFVNQGVFVLQKIHDCFVSPVLPQEKKMCFLITNTEVQDRKNVHLQRHRAASRHWDALKPHFFFSRSQGKGSKFQTFFCLSQLIWAIYYKSLP